MRGHELPRVHPAARRRARVTERLDRWRPLTVLHAPGGAGKTTAAAHWAADARAAGEHVGWYDAAAGGPDPQELLRTLAPAGERAALVVDRADALDVDGLLGLVDLVRREPDRHLVLCLRGDHAVVLRLRTEVETELLTAADLALGPDELEALVGLPAPELHAWIGGHVGSAVAGLPGPGEPAGWSRERVRAYLTVRLDEMGAPERGGIALLSALGGAPVGPALMTSVLAGLGGDPVGDFEQVASVAVDAAGLRLRATPALREVLGPVRDVPSELVESVVRLRWWELLRDDPAQLATLVAGASGPVAVQLRAEGLVGPGDAPVDRPADLGACAVRVAATRRRGDLRAAQDAVRRGEALLREEADTPGVVRVFALHAGFAAFEAGDLTAARVWWLRAHRAAPGGDGEAAALLALVAAVEGDQEAVAAWQPWAAEDAEALGLVRAIAALDAGDVREAGRWLGGSTTAYGELWYLAVGVRAAVALLTPARPEALQVLRRQRAERAERAPAGSMARCVLTLAEVDLLLATGRATEAAALLDGLPDAPAARLLRGRLALMTGDLPTASAELAAVAHPPATLRRLRMEALVLTVETHRRAGRTAAARYAADQLALRAPWPRLADLVPGGPVYPATAEVVRLTARERELLAMLRGPMPRDSIASALFVSTNTVKTQLQGLYRKLDVATREEAVARAFALGLLE